MSDTTLDLDKHRGIAAQSNRIKNESELKLPKWHTNVVKLKRVSAGVVFYVFSALEPAKPRA